MLDEWKEFACYLSSDPEDVPIHPDVFEKGAGLRRPLQILARGFLEQCNGDASLAAEQKIRACKWFLRAWTEGLTREQIPVYPDLPQQLQALFDAACENNLLAYGIKKLTTGKPSKKREEATPRQRLEKLKKLHLLSFNDPPYRPKLSLARNDFNAIRYDQIIAGALNRVPLRQQCLVLEGNTPFDGILCAENLRAVALGVAIYYLQTRQEAPAGCSQHFLSLVYSEIGNWLNVFATNKGPGRKSVPAAISAAKLPDGSLLLEKLSLPSGNKLRLNPDWIIRYNARLVDADNLDTVQTGSWIVSDRHKGEAALLHITKT